MSPYETLGVEKDAGADEIRAAYRRRIREAHPDRGGDSDSAAAINAAYDVLGDAQRRAKYDEFGVDPEQPLTREQTVEVSAVNTLLSMFSASVDSDGPLLAKVKAHLEALVGEARSHLKRHQGGLAKLVARRDEYSVERGRNLVREAIDKRIESVRAEAAEQELRIDVGVRALQILTEHKGDPGRRSPPPSTAHSRTSSRPGARSPSTSTG